MKNTLSLCAMIFVFALGCGESSKSSEAPPVKNAPAKPEAEPARDERPVVLFLGDSLTAGYGLAASEAMPALIQKEIDAAGMSYRVINAGRSGDTTAGGLARIDWYLRPELDLAVVVIGLGSNDSLRGLPLAEAEKNLVAIIDKVQAFDPEVKVFLFQMEIFPNMGIQYADQYRAMFPRVAEKAGAVLLPFPLAGVAGVGALNQPDGIHPTAEGTEKYAANVWKALRPHL